MADEIDRAQERHQEWLSDMLRNQARAAAKQQATASAVECEDCGDDIPDARRQALPGVQRCIHCQTIFERVNR